MTSFRNLWQLFSTGIRSRRTKSEAPSLWPRHWQRRQLGLQKNCLCHDAKIGFGTAETEPSTILQTIWQHWPAFGKHVSEVVLSLAAALAAPAVGAARGVWPWPRRSRPERRRRSAAQGWLFDTAANGLPKVEDPISNFDFSDRLPIRFCDFGSILRPSPSPSPSHSTLPSPEIINYNSSTFELWVQLL